MKPPSISIITFAQVAQQRASEVYWYLFEKMYPAEYAAWRLNGVALKPEVQIELRELAMYAAIFERIEADSGVLAREIRNTMRGVEQFLEVAKAKGLMP